MLSKVSLGKSCVALWSKTEFYLVVDVRDREREDGQENELPTILFCSENEWSRQ